MVPCNVFGPHDNYNLQAGHVLPALIHKAYVAKKDGTPLQVFYLPFLLYIFVEGIWDRAPTAPVYLLT